MSPAAATLDQIRYAQEHIGGDEYQNCEDYNDTNSKDGDYKDRSEDDNDDSESPTMLGEQDNDDDSESPTMSGERRSGDFEVGIFEYSDDDYNHLDDDDLNEDERLIENADSKKRVKVGRRRGNLITGGPVVPNYDGMSVADAHEAKQNYLTERKKFRNGV